MELLPGKKTFLVALLMAAYAVVGVIIGQLDSEQALQLLLEAGGLAALRQAVK